MSRAEHLKERLVEAARYALLRRLAPALRHNMAGALQPISMMIAILEKRMQKPEPDMVALGKNGSALNTLAREASLSCMDLMAWLAPLENSSMPLAACIADAVGLVATELSFKGLTLVNEATGIDAEVPIGLVRNVFMAALIALTDNRKGPADLVFKSVQQDGELLLTLSLVATQGEIPVGGLTTYRDLRWDDVMVLAEAESVSLSHNDLQAQLRWPLPQAAASGREIS
jgi:hypothetical protein